MIFCSYLSSQAVFADLTQVRIVTVEKSNDRVNTKNGKLIEEKPGWFIELSRRAAQECNAELQFSMVPWGRGLKMLELGKIDAIFNSSYMEAREKYGVYPRIDGELDEQRASLRYGYYLYVLKDSEDKQMKDQAVIAERHIIAERASSIIPELKRRGALIQEHTDFMVMLKMVAHRRVDAAIGIDKNFDAVLHNTPALAAAVMKVETPIQLNIGYVMFSKKFYTAYPEQVECFWHKSAEYRQTIWFKKLVQSY